MGKLLDAWRAPCGARSGISGCRRGEIRVFVSVSVNCLADKAAPPRTRLTPSTHRSPPCRRACPWTSGSEGETARAGVKAELHEQVGKARGDRGLAVDALQRELGHPAGADRVGERPQRLVERVRLAAARPDR